MAGLVMRATLLGSAALLAMPAAANTSATEPSEEAKAFFRLMAGELEPGPKGQPMTVSNGRIHAGYYRIIVRRAGSQDTSLLQGACEAALKPYGANKSVLNLIFSRKSDAGVTIRLPLETSGSSADAPDRFAQVNLFRLHRSGSGKCRVALSYFDQHEAYFSPLVRIDQSLTADAQRAMVEFKPWVSVEANRSRLDGLWNLASKAIPLLGPVGAIIGGGRNEDGSDADKYQIKDDLKNQLFGVAGEVQTPAELARYNELVVNPTTGSSHNPDSLKFDWKLDWIKSDEPFSFTFGYTVDLDYRGSMLFPGREYPALGQYKKDDFRKLATSRVPAVLAGSGEKNWTGFDPALANLAAQTTKETVEAACAPALVALEARALSHEDQMLLVYAIANGVSGLSPYAVGGLKCLTENPRAAEALARFGIKLARPPIILPATGAQQWDAAHAQIFAALRSPLYADQSGLERMLAENVLVGGDSSILVDKDGKPVFANRQGEPVSVSRADFLAAMQRVKLFDQTGCGVPRDGNSATAHKPAPLGSGLPDAGDRFIGLLARRGAEDVAVILAGLGGKDTDGNPVVTSLWAGRRWSAEDATLDGIRIGMQAFDAPSSQQGRCAQKAPAFRSFISGPPEPGPVMPTDPALDGG